MKLFLGSNTDIGSTREVNQDAFFSKMLKGRKDYLALSVVCDGIGGLSCGEVASGFVVGAINDWWNDISKWVNVDAVEPEIIFSHLKDAAEEWNSDLLEYRLENDIQTGTTMSLLITVRNKFYVIQVGDSRVYLLRNGELSQLTIDATVSRLNSNGVMKPYLSNFMGKEDNLYYTEVSGEILSGDLFFVCSDGFYHNLSISDINLPQKNYLADKKLESLCKSLTTKMIERGERDNISVSMLYFK